MHFTVNMVLFTRSSHQISFFRYSMCVLQLCCFFYLFKLDDSHHAAADVHQATFTKSAIVGCRYRRKENNWRTCISYQLDYMHISTKHPSVSLYAINSTHYHLNVLLLVLSGVEVYVSYHKHSSGCSSSFTVGHPFTHRLVVKWLFAVVEGIIVQCVHQVGINITEEHANLQGIRDTG